MILRRFTWFCAAGSILWLGSLVKASYALDQFCYSAVLLDKHDAFLSAKVACDGQWRFPITKKLPETYKQALIFYEDKNFYRHFGIDPFALVRAFYQNLKNGKVISGASTISMQLARLCLKNKSRSIFTKLEEMYLTIGFEFLYSKEKILQLYSGLAPFGSNVVGLETAIWKYYHKRLEDLSWAEAALFAVLPNQPSMLHLSKNREKLLLKRNRLLRDLNNSIIISQDVYSLSIEEPLPDKPLVLPRNAPHALEYAIKLKGDATIMNSTIDLNLQNEVIRISRNHHRIFKANEIHNLAVLVVENKSGNILAYLGNSMDSSVVRNADVDMVHAPRSSGSVLKPLLLVAMMDLGLVGPGSLVPDIPTLINGFRPENFSRQYSGAVSCREVIQKSLNVPSVLMLKEYGIPVFYANLKRFGFSHLFRPWEDYGLSLILGGAEVNMADLARTYAYLAHTLNVYQDHQQKYPDFSDYHLRLLKNEKPHQNILNSNPDLQTAGAIHHMFQSMRLHGMNQEEFNIHTRNSLSPIALKTGTSFGYKDAWCVGVNPDYTVVVWIGNANGMARPGLIGIQTAAPLMQEIIQLLPAEREWTIPYDDMVFIPVCRQSGFTPGRYCTDIDTQYLPKASKLLKTCTFHQKIFLDTTLNFRVFKDCESQIVEANWFVLPPAMEYFYASAHPEFKAMPPLREDCREKGAEQFRTLAFIYPNHNAQIMIPVDLDLQKNPMIFKATHRDPGAEIMWFMDNTYIASSNYPFELTFIPPPGRHHFMIMDREGHSSVIKVDVVR
ncbi:MAG: penicillin-binding protein 1C [Saprospiraceae bacterium]|nr:penicillin-binding protein 1C [Candidatus Vicinibacter affinis]MBK6572273.1 penicillin-binding protein 1C [Candidatus Vicinibacter affinis]MBK7304050.1 penicillin-binding protein 1C [Candidatus Vicinibacter affinis]MBK7799142.1 penicillin-binding protein 1C [Candidatus Vicinibacter affinis]MBP6173790.1 penicillin-binding protein 1C [Saprospiraceae bacterium]